MKPWRSPWLWGTSLVVLAGLLSLPAANLYYRASWGEGCARCHEIRASVDRWRTSTHRKVNCTECHDSSLETNLRHVSMHANGEVPEQIVLRQKNVFAMVERCRNCHRQEFAQWQSGPHATTYARILTDKEHNRKRALMDDCFRCHGMHFEGSIRDAVAPLDTKGPWKLKDAAFASLPAIPCLACHAMHREGTPLEPVRLGDRGLGARQELFRPSLALFDRRARLHISAGLMTVPAMLEGARAVKMSPDRRQALCYQCHAPLASMQAGSGDDRTAMGVHEGISCLACHQKHSQLSRASCATCHPRLSNCGLDVEKMDTTFFSKTSKHDVHWVKCTDCHPKGIPAKRKLPAFSLAD